MSEVRRSRRIELVLAALAFAVPLYYLVTERTRSVFVVTWSKPWAAAILLYTAGYVLLLRSYRAPLRRSLETARSLAVVVVVATLAALVSIELALRVSDDAPFEERDNSGRHAPDPDVGHVYVPNFSQELSSREHRATWRSNAQGVRAERDFGPKPAGVFRAICVGDSFTACDQVDYRESWPAVLESCLNAELGPGRVEVIDAGFPGYATVNEARWIAKFAAAFEPDLVLVAATPNDLLENQFPLQYTARDGALISSASTDADRARYEHRSHAWCLAGVVDRSLLMRRIERSVAARRLLGRPPVNHMEAYMVAPNDKAKRLFELAEGYVREARANATALDAKFGLVVIPYSHQLRPLGPALDPTLFGRHWSGFGEREGFPVVDCLPAFLTHEDPFSLHWKEDTHCTAAGYALVARTVCADMLAQREAYGLPRP